MVEQVLALLMGDGAMEWSTNREVEVWRFGRRGAQIVGVDEGVEGGEVWRSRVKIWSLSNTIR